MLSRVLRGVDCCKHQVFWADCETGRAGRLVSAIDGGLEAAYWAITIEKIDLDGYFAPPVAKSATWFFGGAA
jgi:hypothetical protein